MKFTRNIRSLLFQRDFYKNSSNRLFSTELKLILKE